ncbi:hypothetical protein [Zoogloea sp.]|uniref:hypothetical protein n=1 Tax=Zoogloea sp. TaxID=49181 RepID=UPI0035B258DF
MQNRPWITLALGALTLLTVPGQASFAADAHHHHEHHGAAPAAGLHLNAGARWETDAPLRQVMGDINQALADALPAIHRERFGKRDYTALASTVERKIAYAVEHCRLAPEADEMLHLIIADMLGGAEMMRGKTPGQRHAGAARLQKALQAYGTYFEHPGWQPAAD